MSVCDVLDVSRSAYYAWRSGDLSPRRQRDEELTPLVRALFWKHRRRYGARRIAEDLADLGEAYQPQARGETAENTGFASDSAEIVRPQNHRQSAPDLGYSPNLLLEAPTTTRTNQLWVGDITYVPLRGGTFSYLAMLMDQTFAHYLVGWRLAEALTDELVLPGSCEWRFTDPCRRHKADPPHRPRRSVRQLALASGGAAAVRASPKKHEPRANCYDNAFMESCFENDQDRTRNDRI